MTPRRESHWTIRPALIGAVGSEALKLWTLRSNRILMIAAVALVAGAGTLQSFALVSRLTDPRFAGQPVEATATQFVDSVLWAQILVAVVGVLAVTGEYASGQVRLSLLSLPARLPWLAAKALVLAAAGFLVGVVGSALSLAVSVLVLGGTDVVYPVEPGDAAALCLRSGLYLAAVAALAVGLAAVLRHVVAALVAVLALLIVVPPVASSLPGIGWIAEYTPSYAGRRLISDLGGLVQLTPWAGYGVLLAWAAAALLVAGVLLRARDA